MSSDAYRLESARNGETTASRNGRALHSRFDPTKEAVRTAAQIPDTAAIVVLGGLALAYVAEALIEAAPERRLIIADADPQMPAVADQARNIRGLIENPSVSILAGGNPEDISELLRGGPSGAEVHYLEWKPSAALYPEWYQELRNILGETIRRREVNARTLDRFGPLWVRNLAANGSAIARGLSLAPWENRFRDIPALILAGGPSLENILPHLKILRENHLIIAVDTAMPAVLRSGVIPDIVAAVDPQYWNTRHLDRCTESTGNVLILAESATHPAVFRKLKGRPWLTRTRFPLGTLLEDAAGIEGELKAGGSVATAAWDLARHLGCTPMSIAGLDLGFPGGRTHYSGSLSRELPLKSGCRTAPSENAFFHALHDAGARPVAATGGGTLLSDRRMDVYAAWFAESVAEIPDRHPSVVGTGGRRVEGMECVSIERLKTLPSVAPIKKSLLDEIRSSRSDPEGLRKMSETIDEVLGFLDALESAALEGIDLVRQATNAVSEGKDSSRFISGMDEVDQRILGGGGRELISFLIQPIILEITSAGGGDDRDPLATSLRLYREMADSATYHIRHLRRMNFPSTL